MKSKRGVSLPSSTDALVYGKVPPNAIDLEKAILGAIMLDKAGYDVASELLSPECFYVDAHQRIFRTFIRLANKMATIDEITTIYELKASEELDIIGGPFAISNLTKNVVSSANLDVHCMIVKQKYLQRELIRISGETIVAAYEDSTDAFELKDAHETQLLQLTSSHLKSKYVDASTLYYKRISRIAELKDNPQQFSGVPTGFATLDRLTYGWQPTDLIILAARPSVGKTAFALNLARNAATNKNKPTPVGFFSLEMSAGQLFDRMLASESQLNLDKILRGRLNDEEMGKLYTLSASIDNYKIYIDDTPGLNIYELRANARRMVKQHGIGLIIIDYLQLMSGVDDKHVSSREQEISRISRSLKTLAKELNIPIIALSQLSRMIETRKGGEPQLSDLRESGAIEQDADLVAFLTRPDYQKVQGEVDPVIKNDADIKIKKHRNGMLADLAFKTELSIQTWFDLSQYDEYIEKQNNF